MKIKIKRVLRDSIPQLDNGEFGCGEIIDIS